MPHSLRLFVILAAVTAAAYAPAWHGGVLWDDEAHLTAEHLRSSAGLWRIWFDIGATQQYYPLVHSAFWAFYQLWGLETLGYHLVNIALHAASASLLYSLLHRLRVPGAVVAATVFALHPVHVESVAWVTERKNVLSGLFYLLAMWAYLRSGFGFRVSGVGEDRDTSSPSSRDPTPFPPPIGAVIGLSAEENAPVSNTILTSVATTLIPVGS